eukprot:TRINITY_DN6346_c0_g2_i1.p3 TRINITY_DN6346_c0_g2~~TRINITY_DN6346_c0_g2_i1.p3  ORF type:complete len:124 (-),score=3.17 TRINITY_DN6346_c0_g2_i1:75-446(-)
MYKCVTTKKHGLSNLTHVLQKTPTYLRNTYICFLRFYQNMQENIFLLFLFVSVFLNACMYIFPKNTELGLQVFPTSGNEVFDVGYQSISSLEQRVILQFFVLWKVIQIQCLIVFFPWVGIYIL